MMQLHVSDRLVRDPAQKTSASGKAYVHALMTASRGDSETLITLMAFDTKLGNLLASLKKGDSLSAIGAGSVRAYIDKEGNPAAGIPPDEPTADRHWAQEPARVFLERNPDVQLHHMHDPNQDRLMIQRMTYFRLKRQRLGPAYERFLHQTLAPGGTILLVECGLKWPTTCSGERHVFQFGALGGATVDEYHHGGERVRDYLARYHAGYECWQPPPPDGESPEAEGGFEPSLRHDVEQVAQQQGLAGSTDTVSATRGRQSAGGRLLPLVEPPPRSPGTPPAGRVVHLDGTLLDDSDWLGALLDGV